MILFATVTVQIMCTYITSSGSDKLEIKYICIKAFFKMPYVHTKEQYQWNASFDRFRGISVHRSPVQADSASPVVGYFRFHCLH